VITLAEASVGITTQMPIFEILEITRLESTAPYAIWN